MFSPQQEVVLDGELSLDLHIDGDMSLDIPVDGEAGTVIKVTEHDLPVESADDGERQHFAEWIAKGDVNK